VVALVVVDGKGPMAFDYVEHNARQPSYRHRAGQCGRYWELAVFETI
jgi:hypothetical protein